MNSSLKNYSDLDNFSNQLNVNNAQNNNIDKSSVETLTKEEQETFNNSSSIKSKFAETCTRSISPDLDLTPLNKRKENANSFFMNQRKINQINKYNDNVVLKQMKSACYISNPLCFLQPSHREFIPKSYLDSPLQMELSTPPPLLESNLNELASIGLNDSPPLVTRPKKKDKKVNNLNLTSLNKTSQYKTAFEPVVRENKIISDNESEYSSSIENTNNFFVPIASSSSVLVDTCENSVEKVQQSKVKISPRRILPCIGTMNSKTNQISIMNKTNNNDDQPILKPNKEKPYLKSRNKKNRANSLIANNSLIQKSIFKRSRSNDSKSDSINDLNKKVTDLINRNENDENKLSELTKVLLIELKRSFKKSDTTATDDSPISFRSLNNSNYQSLSSRQDSSMSAGNDIDSRNPGILVSEDKVRLRPPNVLNETKKNHLKNTVEWQNRRKDLMKKSKKWSNALELDTNSKEDIHEANYDSVNTDDSFVSNLGSFRDLNNQSLYQVEEEKSNTTRSTITHSKKSNQISIYHSDYSHNSTESNNSLPNQNVNSVESSQSNFNSNESSSSPNNPVKKQSRQLPKIPISSKNRDEQSPKTENNQNDSFERMSYKSQKSFRRIRASLDCNDSLKIKDEKPSLQHKHFSKSIDSLIEQQNSAKNFLSPSFKSVNKSLYSPQRSIDYPYILRKTPKLSDMVRKRLLFQKVSRHTTLFGEWRMNSSTEKEHVPKAIRKMIIRQDNSIEISMSRPPKLRQHTMSEDMQTVEPTNNELNAMQGLIINNNTSMLSVSSIANDRRKTIETCENIFLQSEESTKLRARTPPSNPHRILLYKDKSDNSIRSKVFIFATNHT